MACEQDQPIGIDDQHAGCQMGIVTITGIEERQRLGPHRFTSSGRRGSRQERSRRVPLVGVTHSHDGIDEPSIRSETWLEKRLKRLV